MTCRCKRKSKTAPVRLSSNHMTETSVKELEEVSVSINKSAAIEAMKTQLASAEATDGISLPQCYLCAKKHISRAQLYFEEYHTGYPERLKILIQSLRVAEAKINEAFQKYCKTLSHLDMAAGELLGNNAHGTTIDKKHVDLANSIREERLKFQDDPLYVPDFEKLLTETQLLQYAE